MAVPYSLPRPQSIWNIIETLLGPQDFKKLLTAWLSRDPEASQWKLALRAYEGTYLIKFLVWSAGDGEGGGTLSL